MAAYPRFATASTPFPKFATASSTYPTFGFSITLGESQIVPQFVRDPNSITDSPTPEDNSISASPTTQAPTDENSITESPTTQAPTFEADHKSDYDYEELSVYDIMRDKLEELKIAWPLTDKDEKEITKKHKASKNSTSSPDDQLIRNAYLRGDTEQKKIMLEIADKLTYTL